MKKLEWTTEKIKVADLIELEFNPRKISEEKKKKLIESLEKFNLVEIPAVNTDMKIIGGNQRVKALIIAGRGDELIDVRVPNRKLSQKEVKEYNLISNSHAGEFDFDIIMSDFGDIDFEDIGFDIGKIEFETSDLYDKSLKKFEKKKEIKNKSQVEEDDFDESQNEIKTDIVYGDLFQIGEHRLLCGDAFNSDDCKKLMQKNKANCVITDPPYEIDFNYSNTLLFSENSHVFIFNNDRAIVRQLKESPLEFKKFFVFNHSGCAIPQEGGNECFLDHILISHEINGKPKIRFNKGDGLRTVIRGEYRRSENHKHEKPASLLSDLLKGYSNEGSIVLDFFAGGGSLMSACQQLGRICYCMELEPKNCQIIIDRMEKCYNIKSIKIN